MYKEKFAIKWICGNDETVLRYFDESEKAAALSAGKEIAKSNAKGVIACVLAFFDKEGNMKNGECEVFEVWVRPRL